MGRINLAVFVLLVIPVCCVKSVFAQQDSCSMVVAGELFCDDLMDGDAGDGEPVRWVSRAGAITVENNSLVIRGQKSAIAEVSGIILEDTSIRARATMTEGGAFGVAVRQNPGANSYSGSVGRIVETVQIGGPGNLLRTANRPFQVGLGEDVMMQFDAIGNELNFWAWRPNEAMPSQPLVSMTDDSLQSGGIRLWVASDDFYGAGEGQAAAEFRFVQVADMHVPEPSTAMLCFFGMIGLVAWPRKTHNLSRI